MARITSMRGLKRTGLLPPQTAIYPS